MEDSVKARVRALYGGSTKCSPTVLRYPCGSACYGNPIFTKLIVFIGVKESLCLFREIQIIYNLFELCSMIIRQNEGKG